MYNILIINIDKISDRLNERKDFKYKKGAAHRDICSIKVNRGF